MNKMLLKAIVLSLVIFPFVQLNAQCEIDNRYFQAGEVLTYDLYFKYGIINKKAGSSSLTVENDTYNGRDVYKMSLRARSSGLAKSIFSISDTLTSYMSKDLVPLAYSKDAHESDDHTVERATYSYSPDGIKAHNRNVRNGKLRYDTTLVSPTCMYDMVSIVYYARTLDYASMKKGDKTRVSFLSGRKRMNMDIEYHGIESVSANDDNKYNCIKLVLVMNDDAFENKNEAMKVYITDDLNRIPIRIDSKLKVGSTRVIMKSYKGQRY